MGWHSCVVVSTLTPEQEGPGFESTVQRYSVKLGLVTQMCVCLMCHPTSYPMTTGISFSSPMTPEKMRSFFFLWLKLQNSKETNSEVNMWMLIALWSRCPWKQHKHHVKEAGWVGCLFYTTISALTPSSHSSQYKVILFCRQDFYIFKH